MNNINASREPKVRRTDLHLRTTYLDLKTTIYRINYDKYVIHIDTDDVLFEEIENYYEGYIRPVTLRASLGRSVPVSYEAIVPGIEDNDIPKNFAGISMSCTHLQHLLQSKFPHVNVYDVSDDETLKIFVAIRVEKTDMGTSESLLAQVDRDKLISFVDCLGVGLKTEVIETRPSSQLFKPLERETSLDNKAPFKSYISGIPDYQQRDNALWFDNVESIYRGSFRKSDLYFYNPNEFYCYIDCSAGGELNIRNFLLLYGTVIITPPFLKDLRSWLKEQKLSSEDLFYLIERGRIKLLLTQPLHRYDQSLFDDIFRINPNSIITERAAATLLQTDISEMADNYFFAQDTDFVLIKQLAEMAGKFGAGNQEYYYQMLTWPIRAKRRSFESLHWSGVSGTANFGINTVSGRLLRDITNQDRDVELMASAGNIHIAHAMNATYFPYTLQGFSDEFYTHLMGNCLNLFKYTSVDFVKANSEGDISIPEYKAALNPVDIFEVNGYIDISDFEQLLAEIGNVPQGIQLMEHLSKLSPNARTIEISKYNQEVNKIIGKKKSAKRAVLDVAIDVTLDGIGAVSQFDWIGTIYSGLKWGAARAAKSLHVKKLEELFWTSQKKNSDQRHIHFLSQINRVAKIRSL